VSITDYRRDSPAEPSAGKHPSWCQGGQGALELTRVLNDSSPAPWGQPESSLLVRSTSPMRMVVVAPHIEMSAPPMGAPTVDTVQ
jgi:hypothetical protein